MGIQVLVNSKPLREDFLVRVERVSEEEFDTWTNEDTRYELLDNVLIMHSPATVDHEDLFGFLFFLMRGFVDLRELGRVFGSQALIHPSLGVRLAPDLMFVSLARAPLIGAQVEGTADLIVEILSPSTRAYDLGNKREVYRKARTQEIWFIDPKHKSVIVDQRSGRSYKSRAAGSGRLESKAVRGFWLDIAWLWRKPLPKSLDCLERILAG